MSSPEQFTSGRGMPQGVPPSSPVCPKCSRAMTVKQVTPVLFASNMDDMVFGCGECGTEVKQTVRRA